MTDTLEKAGSYASHRAHPVPHESRLRGAARRGEPCPECGKTHKTPESAVAAHAGARRQTDKARIKKDDVRVVAARYTELGKSLQGMKAGDFSDHIEMQHQVSELRRQTDPYKQQTPEQQSAGNHLDAARQYLDAVRRPWSDSMSSDLDDATVGKMHKKAQQHIDVAQKLVNGKKLSKSDQVVDAQLRAIGVPEEVAKAVDNSGRIERGKCQCGASINRLKSYGSGGHPGPWSHTDGKNHGHTPRPKGGK